MIITGKTTAPTDVTGFTAVQSTVDLTKINLSWTNISDADLKGYKIYLEGTAITDVVYGNTYVHTTITSGDLSFSVKAIDTSGNLSTNFTSTTVNVSIPSDYLVTITTAEIQAIVVESNALTATKLATARNINGVPFDGTTDITVASVNGVYFRVSGGVAQLSIDNSTWTNI